MRDGDTKRPDERDCRCPTLLSHHPHTPIEEASPVAVVILNMDETDFEQLSIVSMQWCYPGGRNDWTSQPGRFETRAGDTTINWEFRYAYWVGEEWATVLFARAYLDAIGQPYQVLWDIAENPDSSWVIITDYADPVWRRPVQLTPTTQDDSQGS